MLCDLDRRYEIEYNASYQPRDTLASAGRVVAPLLDTSTQSLLVTEWLSVTHGTQPCSATSNVPDVLVEK